jgi:hypothetical protein
MWIFYFPASGDGSIDAFQPLFQPALWLRSRVYELQLWSIGQIQNTGTAIFYDYAGPAELL